VVSKSNYKSGHFSIRTNYNQQTSSTRITPFGYMLKATVNAIQLPEPHIGPFTLHISTSMQNTAE
jgi:hypothetical protein